MTFWLRRCTEQSRTPSAHAVPWPSAITCTSTWRAPVTRRSRNTHAAAEGALGLQAGALVGVGELVVAADDPDAPAAAAGGRLEHQRVADLGRRALGRVQALDRAAAPRRHRDADLLGDQLRADLVAELAHRVRRSGR